MSAVRVVGDLDPSFGWDGSRLLGQEDLAPGREAPPVVRGAVATAHGDDGARCLARDPLGIGKLFWCEEEDGLAVSARPARLVAEGFPFSEIRAVPRGAALDVPAGAERTLGPEPGVGGERDLGAAGREIREALDLYLEAVAAAHPSADVFVCLSGGLDSSGIATLVRDHFPGAVAVSFDLEGEPSDDRVAAERVARELGLPLITTTVSRDRLLSHLDTVLVEGIDWRDFNVHAGLVNAALAEAIAAETDDGLVLTGDLANEFLVDYAPESYRGRTYYDLPRVSPASLRSGLVRGLDSCHREIGVFAAWGLSLLQPYAVAVDAYMGLPEDFLALDDRKERLCGEIFGPALPAFVLSRPKARAQVGGSDGGGGVLGACVDAGVDAAELRRRFAALHGVEDERQLDRFSRAGRLRSGKPRVGAEA